jgi:hypothetical protein
MNQGNRRAGVAVATAAMVLVTAGTAAAFDRKSYPGAACQTSLQTDLFIRDGIGAMFSQAAGPQRWVCPVVRENTNAMANGIGFGRMWVVDQHPVNNISCTLWSRTETGAAVAFSTRVSAGAAAAPQFLNFNAMLASANFGYYQYQCTIPQVSGGLRSGVVSYLVDEN